MVNSIKQEAEKRMQKTIESLENSFSKIRTGRASVGLLEHIQVNCYGSMMPLNQVANVNISDARTLMVTPWDKSSIAAVEKAILTADLGLNPMTTGTSIRVPMPPLTEERRKDIIRVVRADAEQARVSIRNIRRDANAQLKEAVKDKLISDDEERRGSELIQKLTDTYIALLDKILAEKEKVLMDI